MTLGPPVVVPRLNNCARSVRGYTMLYIRLIVGIVRISLLCKMIKIKVMSQMGNPLHFCFRVY